MSETERGDFRLKFEMVDLSINDSVCQSLSLRGKGREQRGAEESTAEGTVSTVLVTGDRHTQVTSAVKHISYIRVYEVAGAFEVEGVGAERHFETTALMR